LNPFRVLDLDDFIPRVEKHNPGLWCLTPSAYLFGAIRLAVPYQFTHPSPCCHSGLFSLVFGEKSAGISSFNLLREILVAVPRRQKRNGR